MARMIPPVLSTYRYDGEREIALKLQSDLATENWSILHSLDIAGHQSQVAGECDFVIIIPGKGVLCLEVKGCRSLKVDGGLWYYGTKPQGDKRGPFKQASENMHSIRKYLLDRCPAFSQVVFWSAVIFPYISFSKSSAEWHDWQVIDSRSYNANPLSQLLLNIINQARSLLSQSSTVKWFKESCPDPDLQQVNTITDILRPEFEFYETPSSRYRKLHESLKQYTEEQFIALDAMQMNPRVVFNGPAGTGKTLLAIEAARRAIQEGRKTLLLCFNKNISQWIKLQFSEDDFQNLTVTTLHALMLSISKSEVPVQGDSKYWTDTLPEQAIEMLLAETDQGESQFDEIVIDEAQDILRQNYIDFIDLCLTGGVSAGGWKMFGDFVYQQIYSAATMQLKDFLSEKSSNTPVYTLGINCRNTPRVAAYAPLLGGLTPDYRKILRADDNIKPELVFYEDDEEQKKILSEHLYQFREKEKFKGSEIMILSPLSGDCCAAHLPVPWRDRVKQYKLESTSGHIRYSTIHSFKGLESPVIIVSDLNKIQDTDTMNLLYVAVTRSLARLVLLIHKTAQGDLKKILGVE